MSMGGGGDLNAIDGPGGETEDSSDSAISYLNPIASVDSWIDSGLWVNCSSFCWNTPSFDCEGSNCEGKLVIN